MVASIMLKLNSATVYQQLGVASLLLAYNLVTFNANSRANLQYPLQGHLIEFYT